MTLRPGPGGETVAAGLNVVAGTDPATDGRAVARTDWPAPLAAAVFDAAMQPFAS